MGCRVQGLRVTGLGLRPRIRIVELQCLYIRSAELGQPTI